MNKYTTTEYNFSMLEIMKKFGIKGTFIKATLGEGKVLHEEADIVIITNRTDVRD